jgi:molybdopterin converting factor small subunit
VYLLNDPEKELPDIGKPKPHLVKYKELIMKVNLKCFSTLANPVNCDFKESTIYEMEDGHTVEDLVRHAGIDGQDVKVAFVNSRIVDLDTRLADGDQVGLAPAVGGM